MNGQINIFVVAAFFLIIAILIGVGWGLALLVGFDPMIVPAIVVNGAIIVVVALVVWARCRKWPDE